MRHRGVVCEKSGVEVIQSKVRRERMGHIELATSVVHIWFLKSSPAASARSGYVAHRNEKVLYFESYIVIDPARTRLNYKDLLTESQYAKSRGSMEDYCRDGRGGVSVSCSSQSTWRNFQRNQICTTGRRQLDVAHAFRRLWTDNFDAAFFTDDAAMPHPLIFTAVALVIFGWAKILAQKRPSRSGLKVL